MHHSAGVGSKPIQLPLARHGKLFEGKKIGSHIQIGGVFCHLLFRAEELKSGSAVAGKSRPPCKNRQHMTPCFMVGMHTAPAAQPLTL